MEWFSADLHFCHDKEFIYRTRGFSSIEEHDKALIERWNSVVAEDDDIYLLGDLALGDIDVGIEKLAQLNGNLHTIIIGNHDTDYKLSLYIEELNPIYVVHSDVFMSGKWRFLLSHYPTITANPDGKGIKKHLINLSGHTHSKDKFYNYNPFIYNVSVDAHNVFPVSVETIKEDIRKEYERYA